MPTFIFAGKLRPEWVSVKLDVADPPLRLSLPESAAGSCVISLLMGQSQLSLVIRTEREPSDIATFRNEMMRVARSVFDAVGYLYGLAMRFEFDSLTRTEPDELKVFLDQVPEIRASMSERPLNITQLLPVAVSSRAATRAMGDLRSAIEVADDTSFFTYRAVEDVMQFFLGEDEDRVKAWELLRSVLRVDRSFLKPLEETSKPARHGRLVSKTREEQVDLLQRAWKVVDRFVAFLHRGGRESLPAALFPPLK